MAAPRPHRTMERLRRRVLSPLFDRLGYDLVPATPDWSHRPTSRREVDTLIEAASRSLERDLIAACIPLSESVPSLVRHFWELIPSAPVRQRRGGSGFNGALQLYVAMRALQPRVVIESGVFRGLTTWIIRQACPEAEIHCHDPDLSGLQYRDARARYSRDDWSTANWSGIDPAATVAFFDDHVAQGSRVVQARERRIARLLFDDDAAGHRIHAHGGPAHPTITMIAAGCGSEPIRWQHNGHAYVQDANDPLIREAATCIARVHAFDDLHRATGYSPARLTSVTLDLRARP